jgi:hypothetical protein
LNWFCRGRYGLRLAEVSHGSRQGVDGCLGVAELMPTFAPPESSNEVTTAPCVVPVPNRSVAPLPPTFTNERRAEDHDVLRPLLDHAFLTAISFFRSSLELAWIWSLM